MRKRLKNLKNKGGHSENGAPRQLLDEALYREHHAARRFDPAYSGFSNASRPRDYAISLRSFGPSSPSSPSSPSVPPIG